MDAVVVGIGDTDIGGVEGDRPDDAFGFGVAALAPEVKRCPADFSRRDRHELHALIAKMMA
jgi:hypothetical protein